MFAKATNSHQAGFGFYKECEKRVKMDIANNKISFTDATKVLESLFTNNIETTEFQAITEEFICDKLQE